MRYSKWALLVFGAGALLGLAVVSVGLPRLGRVASMTMAASIAALPVALVADWRRAPPKPRGRRAKGKSKGKGRTSRRRSRAKSKR
jgi:hypothetical protein